MIDAVLLLTPEHSQPPFELANSMIEMAKLTLKALKGQLIRFSDSIILSTVCENLSGYSSSASPQVIDLPGLSQ